MWAITTTDLYSDFTQRTLFSALVSKKISDDDLDNVNVKLDIPDLPDDVNLIRFQVPTSKNYEWIDYLDSTVNDLKSMTVSVVEKRRDPVFSDEGFFSNKDTPNISFERGDQPAETDQRPSNHITIPLDLFENYRSTNYLDWDLREK